MAANITKITDYLTCYKSNHQFTAFPDKNMNVEYVGFNCANIASDDFAYIRIIHNNIIYDNITNISEPPYLRFSYILNNDKSYRKWLSDGGFEKLKWRHEYVEVTHIDIDDGHMVWYVDEG